MKRDKGEGEKIARSSGLFLLFLRKVESCARIVCLVTTCFICVRLCF